MLLHHGVGSRTMNSIKLPAYDSRLKLSPENLLCNTNHSVCGRIIGMSERLSENDCLLFRGALAELFGIWIRTQDQIISWGSLSCCLKPQRTLYSYHATLEPAPSHQALYFLVAS